MCRIMSYNHVEFNAIVVINGACVVNCLGNLDNCAEPLAMRYNHLCLLTPLKSRQQPRCVSGLGNLVTELGHLRYCGQVHLWGCQPP